MLNGSLQHINFLQFKNRWCVAEQEGGITGWSAAVQDIMAGSCRRWSNEIGKRKLESRIFTALERRTYLAVIGRNPWSMGLAVSVRS